jgi:hypothetical protein
MRHEQSLKSRSQLDDSPEKTEPRSARSNTGSTGTGEPRLLDAAVTRSVKALKARRAALQAQPATDDQLARIWPLWNALPAELRPDEALFILRGGMNQEHWQRLADLRRQFPKSEFPLSSNTRGSRRTSEELRQYGHDEDVRAEHYQALLAAQRWTSLLRFYETTCRIHQDLVARQWAFRDADHHASGRIAIWRTFKELQVTHPKFDTAQPTLSDIAYVQGRYDAYTAALDRALAALERLLYKIPDFQDLPPEPLPMDEVALGVPNPPSNLPRFLYMARLEALGICSPARFAEFMRDDFPKLAPSRRQQFYRVASQPRHGKDPYAALLVWVLDNQPVFNRFGWQANDILNAASEKGIRCHCSQSEARTSFKQWASRHGLKLSLKRGTTPCSDLDIRRSTPLLSPPPVFGDVLSSRPTRRRSS